ncbi:hypothetical protein Pmani_037252 [Petrolisthes manimaculis]|uniref:Uncharacterized protein n=1 Tax=Petrolisthes manimaculis TaxID=1843537 RepID=A0AAE1NGQ1_9EUCA|nr:hypothetical protein Pmani_037252 [Petrolisthes manimaculis]
MLPRSDGVVPSSCCCPRVDLLTSCWCWVEVKAEVRSVDKVKKNTSSVTSCVFSSESKLETDVLLLLLSVVTSLLAVMSLLAAVMSLPAVVMSLPAAVMSLPADVTSLPLTFPS